MARNFCDKPCIFSAVGKLLVLSLPKIEIQWRKSGRKRMPVIEELLLTEEQRLMDKSKAMRRFFSG